MTGWPDIWLLVLIMLVLPPAAAWLFRRAGFPGGAMSAAVAGGLAVGIVLGPSIFGRVHPKLFDSFILGAAEQSQDLRLLQREQGGALVVAEHAHWSETQRQELRAEQERELAAPQAALTAAIRSHQTPLRVVALVLVAVMLLVLGSQIVPVNAAAGFWLSAVNIGMASAIVPGAIAFFIALNFWKASVASAAFIAAALAIGPAALRPEERADADAAEVGGAAMLQSAARVATLIALLALAVALIADRPGISWWCLLPILALPAAWIITPMIGRRLLQLIAFVTNMAVPVVVALTALNLDLFRDFSIWPLLVILIFSDDGRGIGAMVGAMLPGGRRTLRGLRLALGTVAAGSTQLALTTIGVHADIIPPWAALPLLLGVLLIEATSGMRRRLAAQIQQLETTWGKQDSDEIT